MCSIRLDFLNDLHRVIIVPLCLCLLSVPSGGVCGMFVGSPASDEWQTLPEAAAGIQQQRQPEGEAAAAVFSLSLRSCQSLTEFTLCHMIVSEKNNQIIRSGVIYDFRLRCANVKVTSGSLIKI